MKSRLLLFLCIALIITLVACEKTSENDMLPSSNEETFREKTTIAELVVPAYIEISPFGKKHFQIEVIASVLIPDSTLIPTTEVIKRQFTDDWVIEQMRIMSEGYPIFTYKDETIQTKDELLREISMVEQMLENPENHFDMTAINDEAYSRIVEELEMYLLQLKEAYAVALDVYESEVIDLEHYVKSNTSGFITGAVDFGKEREAYLTITRYVDNAGGFVEFNNYDDGVGMPFSFDTNFLDMNDITITKDEAVKIGIEYIERFGETGFSPVLLLAGYCTPRDMNSALAVDEYPQCYKIIFTRSFDGVPTVFREDGFDGFYSLTAIDAEELRNVPYWPQEYVEMVIRDSGVNYMMWQMPTIQASTLNENVELLRFENIMDVFENQVLQEYFPSLDALDPHIIKRTLIIDRIEMGMMQVRIKDTNDSLTMIPVWMFYGKEILQYDGLQPEGYPLDENNEVVIEIPNHSYMIINAIDGSTINPILGY